MLFTKKEKFAAEDTESNEEVSLIEETDTEEEGASDSIAETLDSDGFVLESGDGTEEDEKAAETRQSDEINVYEIDDSNCLWNYVNKISIQGRLYYSGELKVDETNFTKNLSSDRPKIRVASFNLLIQKSTKNGIKKHWIFIKTYNSRLIEWLQTQRCGTWIRVEGRLESARRNTYVNATSITAFSESHMQAIFGDGRHESVMDWKEADKVLADSGGGQNSDEARSRMKQIKNQVRTMESQANTISMEEEDDSESPSAVVMAGEELKPDEIEEIRRNTSRFLIYNDDEGFDDLRPSRDEADDDDDDDDLDDDDDDDDDMDDDTLEEESGGIKERGHSGYAPGEGFEKRYDGSPEQKRPRTDPEKEVMRERMENMQRREHELAERERFLREEAERISALAASAKQDRESREDIFSSDSRDERYPPIPVKLRPAARERVASDEGDVPRIIKGLRPVKKSKPEDKNKGFKSRFS